MKYLLRIFNFLNRWENKIFRKYNDNHQPVSAFVATTVLCCAVAFALLLLILQIAGTKAAEYVPVIPIVCSLLITFFKMYRPLVSLPDLKVKFGYAAYILLIFTVSSALFITLSIIVLLAFCVFLILRYFVPSMWNSSFLSDVKRVRNDDGSEEDVELVDEEIGKRYYKGKKTGDIYEQS